MNTLTRVLALMAVAMLSSVSNADIAIIGGADPSLGNGNFSLNPTPDGSTNGPNTNNLWFEATPNWHNLGGTEDTTTFGTIQGTVGSSEPSSEGAFLSINNTAGNDTGYNVVSAGQTFSTSLEIGRFGGNAAYDTDTMIRAFLFTSTTGVDGNTVLGDITEFGSVSIAFPDSGWATLSFTDLYTTVAGDIGNTFYLGVELIDPTSPNPFPRIDVVQFRVTDGAAIPEPTSAAFIGLGLTAMLVRRRR